MSRLKLRIFGKGTLSGAPVLTLTDGTVNPPTYDIALDATAIIGDTLRLEYATNSGFTGSSTEDHVLTSDDLLGGTVTFAAWASLAGATTYYWRLRLVRGATLFAWSNTLTATTPSGTVIAKWNSAQKSTFITLSASDSIATAPVDQGGEVFVIGDVGKTTGKWYFEVHVTMGTAFDTAYVGLANSLPADFVAPGSATSTFISYRSNAVVYRNSGNDAGANQADYSSPTGTKVIGVAFDADAKKVWFALANTFAGSPAGGTGGHAPTDLTNYYPLFGTQKPADPGTIKSQTSTMTYTPPAGFSPLGGA